MNYRDYFWSSRVFLVGLGCETLQMWFSHVGAGLSPCDGILPEARLICRLEVLMCRLLA